MYVIVIYSTELVSLCTLDIGLEINSIIIVSSKMANHSSVHVCHQDSRQKQDKIQPTFEVFCLLFSAELYIKKHLNIIDFDETVLSSDLG